MKQRKRTHLCSALTAKDIGTEVVLSGWVQRRRDHGGLIFIDLRDRSGLVQIVFNNDFSHEAFAVAQTLRPEFVITKIQSPIDAKRECRELTCYASRHKKAQIQCRI